MPLGNTSVITVGGKGWADKREVRVAGVVASWRISTPGRLSAFVPASTAWLLGIDVWEGLWVRWDHPTQGIWGGVIEDTRAGLDESMLELSCSQFHSLLKRRRTSETYRQDLAPAGALVLRLMTDASSDGDLMIDDWYADEGGPLFDYEWKGDDLHDAVQRVARSSNSEWRVYLNDDWSRAFEFRSQIGTDRRGSVLFAEGLHFGSGDIVRSTANLVNDVLAKSAESDWDTAPGIYAIDPDSIATYGRLQDTRRYAGVTRKQTLRTRAQADMVVDAAPRIPIRIPLRDREPQLVEVREGDTIRVWSSTRNVELFMRVTQRTVNSETGIVTLVGDGEEAA